MKSVLRLSVFAGILGLSLSAAAHFNLGSPSYGGNGCPAGTAAVVVSEDRQTMSVLFDQFKAEAGNTTGRRIDRASCNLRIPLRVEAGYSVALIKVDYRGFNAMAVGGSTTFNAEYFYAGSRGPKHTRKFRGPLADEFTIGNQVVSQVWSPCGKDVIFGINASATAIADSSMQQTLMIVDTADLTAKDLGLRYLFSFRRCS